MPSEFVREFQESTIHHLVPEEFLATVVSESLKLPAHVWRDYMEGGVLSIDREFVDELREIDVPTLILWGSRTSSSRAKNKSGSHRRSPASL